MITANSTPAAHVGEDQSSRQFETRAAHWSNLAVELLLAAKALANDYLQEECADVDVCINQEHHKAVRALCEAIKNADRAGLSDACAVLAAMGQDRGVFWSVTNEEFPVNSLAALISANDWLRPGDIVYQAQAVGRYVLTEADCAEATLANAPQRDPRGAEMFASGGAA